MLNKIISDIDITYMKYFFTGKTVINHPQIHHRKFQPFPLWFMALFYLTRKQAGSAEKMGWQWRAQGSDVSCDREGLKWEEKSIS